MLPRAHFPSEQAYKDYLRDWFAGQALAGSMAAARITGDPEIDRARARNCYLIADAMLAERAKDTPSHG